MIVKNLLTKPKQGVQLNFAHPLTRGLIAYYPFNEGAGKRIRNIVKPEKHSGNLGNFVNANTPTSGWVGSALGGGLMFDGVNDVIDITSSTDFDSTTGTWCGWMKSSATVVNGSTIMTRADATQSRNGIHISRTSSTALFVTIKAGAGSLLGYSASGIKDDILNHWAFTFNGTGLTRFYINGKLSATGTPSGSWTFNSQAIKIGDSSDTFWDKYLGVMDEIRIYNRVLNDSEIKMLYNTPHIDLLTPKIYL